MSRFRRLAAGLVLAGIAALATAAPASAHDQLISSTPDDGEQLALAPASVTMTFSGDLLVLDESTTGATVLVVDASGTDWVASAPTVSGRDVTVDLTPGMPVAGYQVRWQVVSEDGHPIAGVIPFTVGDAAPMPTETGNGAIAPSTVPSGAGTGSTASDQSADETSGAVRVVLVGVGGAALAALAFVLSRFLRRPRAAVVSSDYDESATNEP